MTRPLVTVAMPALNAEATVERAIQSILVQDMDDFELLVLDDGSTDGTAARVDGMADPRVRLLKGDRTLGLATRLNLAIDEAKGVFFARMDADDASFPDRLRLQLDRFAQEPELDLCGGSVLWTDDRERPLTFLAVPRRHEAIVKSPWSPLPLYHPTWMGRTGWFRKNRYDPLLPRSQDAELLLRCLGTSRFGNVEACVLAYDATAVEASRSVRSRRVFSQLLMRQARGRRDLRLAAAAIAYRIASNPIAYRLVRRMKPLPGRPVPKELEDRWAKLSAGLSARGVDAGNPNIA